MEGPETRCGSRGKGSRCRVVWGGLGAYRHGQKSSAERAGHSVSGIPGAGEGVTWDHPEGQRPSAWVKGTTGDRSPAGGLCRAHDRASFNHLPGHPMEASCSPKGLGHPAMWELYYSLTSLSGLSSRHGGKGQLAKGEEVSKGTGEEKDHAPFPGQASRMNQLWAKGREKI